MLLFMNIGIHSCRRPCRGSLPCMLPKLRHLVVLVLRLLLCRWRSLQTLQHYRLL
jgi:hypothetical protein